MRHCGACNITLQTCPPISVVLVLVGIGTLFSIRLQNKLVSGKKIGVRSPCFNKSHSNAPSYTILAKLIIVKFRNCIYERKDYRVEIWSAHFVRNLSRNLKQIRIAARTFKGDQIKKKKHPQNRTFIIMGLLRWLKK